MESAGVGRDGYGDWNAMLHKSIHTLCRNHAQKQLDPNNRLAWKVEGVNPVAFLLSVTLFGKVSTLEFMTYICSVYFLG